MQIHMTESSGSFFYVGIHQRSETPNYEPQYGHRVIGPEASRSHRRRALFLQASWVLGASIVDILLMDKILHYPLEGIYHNSHSLGSLGSCRILSINSMVRGPKNLGVVSRPYMLQG